MAFFAIIIEIDFAIRNDPKRAARMFAHFQGLLTPYFDLGGKSSRKSTPKH